jgi:hypothetical protein
MLLWYYKFFITKKQYGGWGGIRTHSPEGTDLQSAATLPLSRPSIKVKNIFTCITCQTA